MVKRSLGKLSKRSRLLGCEKLGTSRIVRQFQIGDSVHIDTKGNKSGMPHPRYRGKSGKVVGKRGNACIVAIQIGGTLKRLIIPPVHLRS